MSHDHQYIQQKVAVIGAADVLIAKDEMPCDPIEFLRIKKLRKYMGKQDDLAVVAACTAGKQAGLTQTNPPSPKTLRDTARDRIGLYLAVGHIPFQENELFRLASAAEDDGQFSMQKLSTTGFHAVNGLLTFRCLPNMPAFHVSINLDIQGPCYVTYPGTGQLYLALQQAIEALTVNEIDVAFLLGVADQCNYLVEHHFSRMMHATPSPSVDVAGCLVLKRSEEIPATQPILATLHRLTTDYQTFDPFDFEFAPSDHIECEGKTRPAEDFWGPATLPVMLSRAISGGNASFRHEATTRDGFRVQSMWRLP